MNVIDGILILLVSAGVIGVYLLPLFVAGYRNTRHIGGICIVNLFLGWTVIGWLIALAWATDGVRYVKET